MQLYLFKTEKINFVNLLQFCFILSRRDLYQPCSPSMVGTNLSVTTGDFVNTMLPEDPYNFRNLDWTEKLPLLDSILTQTDDPITIGHSDINQLLLLKEEYPDIAQISSCSYTENDYELMLTYTARQHLELQHNGTLPITEHDQQMRSDPSINLLSYYKQSFDEQAIVPKSMAYSTDYSVPVRDFFNKDKFFQHIVTIGADPSPKAKHYYDQWWLLQQSYFNGTQL